VGNKASLNKVTSASLGYPLSVFNKNSNLKLHIAFTGQSTHKDLVKTSGLQRTLFDKSCLRSILLHEKSGLQRMFFERNLLFNHSGIHFI